MENNAVQKNPKVLSEINAAEHSSKDGNKQNDQPNTTAQKTEHCIEIPYKKVSKSCDKLPPLIRKNSSDGLFLSRSMSAKTLAEPSSSYPTEKKSSKTFQTIDIMKIKEGNLKLDELKDAGPNIPEMVNNAGLPSLSQHTPLSDSPRAGFSRRGSSELAQESSVHKSGFFHLSIEKADTKPIADHTPPIIYSKDESFGHEGGNSDMPRSCQSRSFTSRFYNSQCGNLRSSSSLAFSYHSSSGSSSSSSLSQSLSSPRECYLSQSLNTDQIREKQLRKNTQNLKNCLSQEDIPKMPCLSQSHRERRRSIQTCSFRKSLQNCDEDVKGHTGSENLKGNYGPSFKNMSSPLEICQEQTDSTNEDSNIHRDKEATPEVSVSVEKTSPTGNVKNSESTKPESVIKKDLCDKPTLVKPELRENFSRNHNHASSLNQTNSPNPAKVISKQQKMYRSSTVAKIENVSSRNEIQHQISSTLQKRPNYLKSVSSLRPKDVGVCITSATMHKRSERNVTKQSQNKGRILDTKITESKKPLTSELPKRHRVRMAPNGENKPLLDILAQRSQTVSVTKLDSCVKIENMFENLKERKNETHTNNKTANKRNTAVEPNRTRRNISGSKSVGGKLHQMNENQESKKAHKLSNQKRSNEKDGKSQKTSRKHQNKSKQKTSQQLTEKSDSEQDMHMKLSSNMALISGANWHIVTDCFDVSNVKVINHSNVYQDYNSFAKGSESDKDDNDPNSCEKTEDCKINDNFDSDFFNNLINHDEKDVNIRNSNSCNKKLASVDECPEMLNTEEILRNNDWNNMTICTFEDETAELLNVLSEDILVPINEHECKEFMKDLPEDVQENLNPEMAEIDSEYETDFECLSACESDCSEDFEGLSNKIIDPPATSLHAETAEVHQENLDSVVEELLYYSTSPVCLEKRLSNISLPDSGSVENVNDKISDPLTGSLQMKSVEVNQENLDSVVEELLNYSTSPVCLEKRLSTISLPETDSILLRSLKHQKNSPFYAQSKDEDVAAKEEITNDLKEDTVVSVAKKSCHRSFKSQVPHKYSIDGQVSDKELESLSELEELNNNHTILCRRDSASTTSSSLSIGEDFTWKKGDLLGSGSYGTVWRGLTSEGELIAIKQIVLDVTDREKAEREYQKVQEEVEILKTLQHKNIVRFLGMRREGEEVSIFMQYVTGGSIAQLLARFGPLDEPVFCSYTQQILEGVKYLHDKNVIHRDIKGGNVMLMPNSTIKLVDFGCAKRLCYSLNKNSLCHPNSMHGTPYWMAPEVIHETGHGKKSDIWSIGCTVFEMATKSPPWSNMNPYAAIFAICSSKPVPVLPTGFSQKAQDFVRVCLIRDPKKRPTASELLQDKFITTPHHGRRRKSVTCFN